VRIVDDSGADVAAGSNAIGEVIIRGPTVFGGYWQLPEATAESFTPDGWFCTGDLGTRANDGYITVVDRKKDMILCGGENVYSTEVEAVLIAHPAVAQAAVFGVPNAVLGELVAAAVVLRADAAAAAAAAGGGSSAVAHELIDWCRERLAYYKVPSAVHVVDAMPVTGSGKILKTELRQRFAAPPHAPPTAAGTAIPAAAAAAAAADMQLGVPGINLQGLVVFAADAAGPGRLQQLPLAQPDLILSADVSYVLPLTDGVALGQQVQSAVVKGARHLLLLGGNQPSPATLQQLQGVLQEAAAEAAFVILDGPVASDASLLGYALFDAARGMPAIEAVLVPAKAAEASVSGIAAPATAAAAAVPAGESVEAAMASVVKEAIAELLGAAAAGSIGEEDPLMQSGVNSTLAVQLTSELETRLGVSLPATLVSALLCKYSASISKHLWQVTGCGRNALMFRMQASWSSVCCTAMPTRRCRYNAHMPASVCVLTAQDSYSTWSIKRMLGLLQTTLCRCSTTHLFLSSVSSWRPHAQKLLHHPHQHLRPAPLQLLLLQTLLQQQCSWCLLLLLSCWAAVQQASAKMSR
jgi:hypothetical protein